MSKSAFAAACATGLLLACASAGALAQAPYKAPRNALGQPDLSGNWTNATLTTFQRPAEYGERRALTAQEAAKIEGDRAEFMTTANLPTDPSVHTKDLPHECGLGFSGANCGYNAGWIDPGTRVMRVAGEPRASLITYPANGRIPAMKPAAQQKIAARRARPPAGSGAVDNPEQRSLGDRCIMAFGNSTGPVMLPLLYNNTYKIVQTKDHVAILVEMVHDVRVVRLNAAHRTDGVRPYMGDSIGRYEGDTLVIETKNFHLNQPFQAGMPEDMKVTERLTPVGPGRVLYQFRVESAEAWDAPWGGEYELRTAPGDVYEYACHEGNYAMGNIMAGARAEEKVATANR